jgi:hypothetical protein
VRWSETENIKWKTELPGQAWSSPVVSGNEIWMTNATDEGHSLRVICVALDSGKIIHDTEVFHVEKQPFKHALNSYASPSPIIDKGHLMCFSAFTAACINTRRRKNLENTDLKRPEPAGGTRTLKTNS